MDRATYFAQWSTLHGGARPTGVVGGWLTLVHAVARPLVRLRVPPDVVTLLGLLIALSAPWLASLGLDIAWPMNGLPRTLHLDNAAEFKSRALRDGCAEYGIGLTYRPVGRPHFGGHIERLKIQPTMSAVPM